MYIKDRNKPVIPGLMTSHFFGRPGFRFLFGDSGEGALLFGPEKKSKIIYDKQRKKKDKLYL